MIWGLLCALLGVFIAASAGKAEASWQVEHAFGDSAFSTAGILNEGVQASRALPRHNGDVLPMHGTEQPKCLQSLPLLSCGLRSGAAADKRCRHQWRDSEVAAVDQRRRVSSGGSPSFARSALNLLLITPLRNADFTSCELLEQIDSQSMRQYPQDACSQGRGFLLW